MFENTQQSQKSNGVTASMPLSASDQKIEYRPFASSMKVTIDGEEFMIRPPSFHVSNIIRQFKMEHVKKISKQRDVSMEIVKMLNSELEKLKIPQQVQEENAEANVDAVVRVYESLQAELFKIQDMSDREMLRLVQLVILDGKNKQWRDDHDTFPPDSVLENAISMKRLMRQADVVELHVVLDVFNQMNKPEYARKNFQALSPLA